MNGFAAKPKDAALASAERRWNDELTRRYAAKPEIFASVIDAIDTELRDVVTQVEFKTPGNGFAFLMRELQAKLRLGTSQ